MTSYKDSGVDINSGNHLVEWLKKTCPEIGGFGGLYPLNDDYLVAGTDGVGTKLKLAFQMNQHSTIGIDLVAMNVNDIITTGARPLFFLDYFASSKLDVQQAERVLEGILQGCQLAGCILLGGETAEMPGFYQSGEYDLAGFVVGIVPKKELIDGSLIQKGDALVGIHSSGIHSNGYSLVRKVLENAPHPLDQSFDQSQISLGEALLKPTTIYVKQIESIKKDFTIRGMAHITGEALPGNLPRMFPKGLGAQLDKKSWEVPSLFRWLQAQGRIAEDEMYQTFNMGIGMVLALSQEEAKALCQRDSSCQVIGQVIAMNGEEIIWK